MPAPMALGCACPFGDAAADGFRTAGGHGAGNGRMPLAVGGAVGRTAVLMGCGCSHGHRSGQETQWWPVWACARGRQCSVPKAAVAPHP